MMQEHTAKFFDMVTSNLSVSLEEGCFYDCAEGNPYRVIGPNGVDSRAGLKKLLREYIYAKYYSRDSRRVAELVGERGSVRPIVDLEESILGKSLAESCCDCYIYDSGWTSVGRSDNGEGLFAEKAGARIRVESSDFVTLQSGANALRLPAVRRFALAGWTVVFGEAALPTLGEGCRRHYFPVREPSALISTFSQIAHYMNEMHYPFQAKAINDSSRIERTDNVVLFTSKELPPKDLMPLHQMLLNAHGSEMKDPPPMTRHMGHGWGFAEEEPDHLTRLSFGQGRCDYIAEALIGTNLSSSAMEKLARIQRVFSDKGLSIDIPYERRF